MMNGIMEILRLHMGLEASTIGTGTVEQAIRARMMHIGAHSTDEYLLRLRDSPAELDELIEAVVVPESWFFRDGAPFAALASWTREQWLPSHATGTLRVLTVPCSTGEEPYSVAMTLLDAGLPPERFTVDAVDISRHALARAKRGVYGSNSFRGQALEFRDRFFTPGPDGHKLSTDVKRQVRFERSNLLADDFRPGQGRFDVIFCRNLLIYFDRPTQKRAVQTLVDLLAPDGLFFFGHAETAIAVSAGLKTANYPMSFAFRKITTPPPLLGSARPPVTTVLQGASYRPARLADPVTIRISPAKPPATRSVPFYTPRVSTVDASPTSTPSKVSPPAKDAPLDTARALADEGKLEDAARLCEDHLRQNTASAAAWYLLGVVRDAAGDHARAAECYSKTLYLEPNHQEALLQRALLAEQSGDTATAAQLRRRIGRVQGRTARP